MLYLLAAWAVLVAAAGTIGSDILRLARASLLPAADRVFLAVWIGVAALSLALLAASLVLPLTPAIGVAVGVVVAACARAAAVAAHRRRRATGENTSTASTAPPGNALPPRAVLAIGASLVALGAAALASDPVTLYDALVYHVGIGKWLREHGSVPGIALVHNRLGHGSAWFALSAPFDAGPALDRAWNVGMGLALVLVGVHGALGAARIAARVATACDWLIVLCALALIWPVVAYGVASPSPDVAANVLIVLVAWAMCVTAGTERGAVAGDRLLSPRLLPFVLAVGALAVKLFALPAAAAAALFYMQPALRRVVVDSAQGAVSRGRRLATRVAVCAAVGIVMIAPLVATNVVTSGCPLFPSPTGCLDASWSIGPDAARDYATYIRDVARWETRDVPANPARWGWLAGWVRAHPIIAALLVATPLLAVIVLRSRRMEGGAAILLLAILGIGFAVVQAPAPRFLYAYLVVVPALFMAHQARRARLPERNSTATPEPVRPVPPARGAGIAAFLVFATSAAVATAVASQKANLRSALTGQGAPFRVPAAALLIPEPPAGPPALYRRRVNDVDLYTPVPPAIADTLGYRSVIDGDLGFEKCSTAPLPCTPYLPPPTVGLRDPRRGIAGGFARRRSRDPRDP